MTGRTPGRGIVATRVKKARKSSTCPACKAAILTGQGIALLTSPQRWVHITCVPVVAAYLAGKDR